MAEDQFSLAIGKGGQNVRLASVLSGYKIDIKQAGIKEEDDSIESKESLDKEIEEKEEDHSEEKISKS